MASVLKRSGVFYARWKDAAGRQRRQATACDSKKDAQRFADDLERKAERQERHQAHAPSIRVRRRLLRP